MIRKARAEQNEIEIIRTKLIKSERSDFINQTRAEILAEFKAELRHKGDGNTHHPKLLAFLSVFCVVVTVT